MTQLQTFDDTQKLIQKYGIRDPFELIDALPNTKLWPARSLDADGLRGFATIVNRVRYIAVNPHLPYEEQRVIAGHELGHIFEHSNHLRCQAMQDFDIYQATGRLEREANFFAADLLLDDEEVLDQYEEEGAEEKADTLTEALDALEDAYDVINDVVMDEI